ncbi:sugar (pentulose or hexulose) kinase [Herbaspirillum sp. Sphag1AN]|uniref:FGGY-family carbohydrate kinase n=1 Tax=unclassified Herbaspirillum TaxID=2624150 RepID=UPI00160BF985|nr:MULTISPECIES: FGGY family carbohydrate kinase [unclassified Herbaspirillum]MBB3212488.1 sugar (pentulose or hexulose) kinase [Herbaspirillum sp. Sphag1AN]MBB3245413.1 sugar (pentulose or hexulose) kinase [Herbaspirillum sp. Sphag64]
MVEALAVFDIGKTNIKLTLVDDDGRELVVRRRANVIRHDGLYPHHDVTAIESWLLATLKELAQQANITAIVPITHGATAALVDALDLVLPIVDYEQGLPDAALAQQYEALRAPFGQTCSPLLGQGLNLGRQLHWLQQRYPDAFGRARHLLMYPQYWAWRLCGVAAAEVSSLGCHTDLWQPAQADYSTLVSTCGWLPLMPPLRAAWDVLGNLQPHLAAATGLSPACRILCGAHDSNASLLRYLKATREGPRTVLSTGTWVIAAALDGRAEHLQEQSDMLCNVNVLGQPVSCMRFMGGREFAELAGSPTQVCDIADLQMLIDQHSMALPSFADCGGPFAGKVGRLLGPLPASAAQRYAMATLYCVLMTEYCLELLDVQTPVVVEGSFTANPYFAPLLASLAGTPAVYCSSDNSGTTAGGWLLHHWQENERSAQLTLPAVATPLPLRGWQAYRQQWRILIEELSEAGIASASIPVTIA